jgi:uncharacterized protein (DUF4415 family)
MCSICAKTNKEMTKGKQASLTPPASKFNPAISKHNTQSGDGEPGKTVEDKTSQGV